MSSVVNCSAWTGRTLTDEYPRVTARGGSEFWKIDMHADDRGRLFGFMLPWCTCWCDGFDNSGKHTKVRIWRIWLYLPWWIGHIDFDLREESKIATCVTAKRS